jgi:hypothetical protein
MSMSDNGPSKYEFKVTVLATEEHVVRAELKKQGAKRRDREVYFYDTRGLDLKKRKLFLRARTTEGEEPDSTVKLRPLAKSRIPANWENAGYRYESDVIGDKCIPSLKLDRPEGEIAGGDVGGKDADKLFDKAQEKLVPVAWADLKPFGPVHAHLWELEYDALPETLSVEEWTVPGGPHFIELSFKVKPDKKAAAKQAFHKLLRDLAIDPNGDPDPKTTRVLEHFAAKRH